MVYLLQYTKANLFKISGKTLFPGLNEVTVAEWDKMKVHPLLALRFKMGDLAWMAGRGPDDKKPSPASAKDDDKVPAGEPDYALAEYSATVAIDMVKAVFSLDMLEAYKAKETRKSVLKAIESQLDLIAPPVSNEEKK